MTPERIEQERAKFEKNIHESGITSYKQRLKSGEYAYEHIEFAWEMWQARAAQSEWISAKDKLPEEKSGYLTCYVGSVARVCQFDGKKFSYWEYDEEEWEFVEVICIPDYWQPLPEPPETRGK